MKILLTGANGFLGSLIKEQLSDHEIVTLGRSSDIEFDLENGMVSLVPSDCVLHVAGKAHSIPKTLAEIEQFYTINVKGTKNLLDSLENSYLPSSFVYISSVSVYGLDSGYLVDEKCPLNAKDPYGLSKIQAEKLIQEWCTRHNIICTILRLPLLIGPNSKGNLAAMINGIKKGYYLNIGGGKAKKSMVLASDVVKIIPQVASVGGIYNLTDGKHPTFYELSLSISKLLFVKKINNIPVWLAEVLAKIGDIIGDKFPISTPKLKKILSDLTFDDSKARSTFNWNPASVIKHIQINK